MSDPPLSQEQLSTILTSAGTPSELFESLSQYEGQALLLSDSNGKSELLNLFYSAFFFSHLLVGEIPEARMLTKRIPGGLTQNSTALQNCTLVLRAVWQRKYDQIYKLLRELPWPEQLKPLVQRYEVHFQNKTLQELSYTYEAIRPEMAASYLGLDPAAAQQGDPAIIQNFTNSGWKWDDGTKLLYPKPIAAPRGPGQSRGLGEIMALVGNAGS